MAHPWESMLATIDATPTDRVGPATSLKAMQHGELTWNGVATSPVELHRVSGQTRDLYAGARSIRSEIRASSPAAAQLAIAECLRNEAAAKNTGVYQRCVFRSSSEYAWTEGYYGEQHGRGVSTSRDPDRRSLAAMAAALNDGSALTGGARKFFDLETQDGGRQGSRTLRLDAIGVVKEWGAEGWRWGGSLPKVDTYRDVCIFVKLPTGAKADNADLIAVIEDARAGVKPAADALADERNSPLWLLAVGGLALHLWF